MATKTEVAQYKQYAGQMEQQYNLPKGMLNALLEAESSWNPNAVSSAGARGLGQFMPATAKQYGVNVRDPYSSMDGAARYLRNSLDTYRGDIPKTLASYNAGPSAVAKYNGVPPYTETQNYVRKIMNNMGMPQSREDMKRDYLTRTNQPQAPAGMSIQSLANRASYDSGLAQSQKLSLREAMQIGFGDAITFGHAPNFDGEGRSRLMMDSQLGNSSIGAQIANFGGSLVPDIGVGFVGGGLLGAGAKALGKVQAAQKLFGAIKQSERMQKLGNIAGAAKIGTYVAKEAPAIFGGALMEVNQFGRMQSQDIQRGTRDGYNLPALGVAALTGALGGALPTSVSRLRNAATNAGANLFSDAGQIVSDPDLQYGGEDAAMSALLGAGFGSLFKAQAPAAPAVPKEILQLTGGVPAPLNRQLTTAAPPPPASPTGPRNQLTDSSPQQGTIIPNNVTPPSNQMAGGFGLPVGRQLTDSSPQMGPIIPNNVAPFNRQLTGGFGLPVGRQLIDSSPRLGTLTPDAPKAPFGLFTDDIAGRPLSTVGGNPKVGGSGGVIVGKDSVIPLAKARDIGEGRPTPRLDYSTAELDKLPAKDVLEFAGYNGKKRQDGTVYGLGRNNATGRRADEKRMNLLVKDGETFGQARDRAKKSGNTTLLRELEARVDAKGKDVRTLITDAGGRLDGGTLSPSTKPDIFAKPIAPAVPTKKPTKKPSKPTKGKPKAPVGGGGSVIPRPDAEPAKPASPKATDVFEAAGFTPIPTKQGVRYSVGGRGGSVSVKPDETFEDVLKRYKEEKGVDLNELLENKRKKSEPKPEKPKKAAKPKKEDSADTKGGDEASEDAVKDNEATAGKDDGEDKAGKTPKEDELPSVGDADKESGGGKAEKDKTDAPEAEKSDVDEEDVGEVEQGEAPIKGDDEPLVDEPEPDNKGMEGGIIYRPRPEPEPDNKGMEGGIIYPPKPKPEPEGEGVEGGVIDKPERGYKTADELMEDSIKVNETAAKKGSDKKVRELDIDQINVDSKAMESTKLAIAEANAGKTGEMTSMEKALHNNTIPFPETVPVSLKDTNANLEVIKDNMQDYLQGDYFANIKGHTSGKLTAKEGSELGVPRIFKPLHIYQNTATGGIRISVLSLNEGDTEVRALTMSLNDYFELKEPLRHKSKPRSKKEEPKVFKHDYVFSYLRDVREVEITPAQQKLFDAATTVTVAKGVMSKKSIKSATSVLRDTLVKINPDADPKLMAEISEKYQDSLQNFGVMVKGILAAEQKLTPDFIKNNPDLFEAVLKDMVRLELHKNAGPQAVYQFLKSNGTDGKAMKTLNKFLGC